MAHRRGDSLSAPLLVSLATAAISIVPIRSYDAFWHLATGRWIVDHAALPARDPFGLASSDVVWHNGAWLFQILLYGFHRLGGDATLSLARAVTVGLLAGWLFFQARRESPAAGALLLVSVAIYGADPRLAVRPEIAGIVLVALVVTLSLGALSRGALVAIAAVVALWINLHPSALLAPVIVGAAAAGRAAAGERTREDIARFGI
ncbi:MAG TPA: hypothetical protein VLV48_10405, partial [Thermoanaerobaculia bacterium]|nr:hypothetical protein [Thermoanaerobaculia bacterium]